MSQSGIGFTSPEVHPVPFEELFERAGENFETTQAVQRCLDELAYEKRPQKTAAAEALAKICCSAELLPAVDHELVLRRLVAAANTTRNPEALKAAFDVLWRLREEEYWAELIEEGSVLHSVLQRNLRRLPYPAQRQQQQPPTDIQSAAAFAGALIHPAAPGLLGGDEALLRAAVGLVGLLALSPGGAEGLAALAALQNLQVYADAVGDGGGLSHALATACIQAGGPAALTRAMSMAGSAHLAGLAVRCLRALLEACSQQQTPAAAAVGATLAAAGSESPPAPASQQQFRAACTAAFDEGAVAALSRLMLCDPVADDALQLLLLLGSGARDSTCLLVSPLVDGGGAGRGGIGGDGGAGASTAPDLRLAEAALQRLESRLLQTRGGESLPAPMLAALFVMVRSLAAGLAEASGGTEGADEVLERLAPQTLQMARSVVTHAQPPGGFVAIAAGSQGRGATSRPGDSTSGQPQVAAGARDGGSPDELIAATRTSAGGAQVYPAQVERAATGLFILAVRNSADMFGSHEDAAAAGGSSSGGGSIPLCLMVPAWVSEDAVALARLALNTQPAPRLTTLACLGACVEALGRRQKPMAELNSLLLELLGPLTAALAGLSRGPDGGGGGGGGSSGQAGAAAVYDLEAVRLAIHVLSAAGERLRPEIAGIATAEAAGISVPPSAGSAAAGPATPGAQVATVAGGSGASVTTALQQGGGGLVLSKPNAASVMNLAIGLLNAAMQIHAANKATGDDDATDPRVAAPAGDSASMGALQLLVSAVTAAVAAGTSAGLVGSDSAPGCATRGAPLMLAASETFLAKLASATVALTGAGATMVDKIVSRGTAVGGGLGPGAAAATAAAVRALRLAGSALQAANRAVAVLEAERLVTKQQQQQQQHQQHQQQQQQHQQHMLLARVSPPCYPRCAPAGPPATPPAPPNSPAATTTTTTTVATRAAAAAAIAAGTFPTAPHLYADPPAEVTGGPGRHHHEIGSSAGNTGDHSNRSSGSGGAPVAKRRDVQETQAPQEGGRKRRERPKADAAQVPLPQQQLDAWPPPQQLLHRPRKLSARGGSGAAAGSAVLEID